jgi:hypothetical protein
MDTIHYLLSATCDGFMSYGTWFLLFGLAIVCFVLLSFVFCLDFGLFFIPCFLVGCLLFIYLFKCYIFCYVFECSTRVIGDFMWEIKMRPLTEGEIITR